MASTHPHPVRVLIVDDEPLARRRVAELLQDEVGVDVVGTAASGAEAVKAILESTPDIVFLDVQMPDGTGLDVVREVGPERMPITVFVTAYDQYALRAFDAAAVDYLVKPFDDERFDQAFQRARRAVELESVDRLSGQLLSVLHSMQGAGASHVLPSDSDGEADGRAASGARGEPEYLERIAVESGGRVQIVPVTKVLYITASGPYAELHTADRKYLIREQMQVLEDRLDPGEFIRLHRSAIVRLSLIESLVRSSSGDYTVQIKGGLELKVSRSRSEDLERRLGLSK